jgi:hypothetical protein
MGRQGSRAVRDPGGGCSGRARLGLGRRGLPVSIAMATVGVGRGRGRRRPPRQWVAGWCRRVSRKKPWVARRDEQCEKLDTNLGIL